ncbi:MAG: glycoside hydrolase domain-containing protein [Thermoguttaceae bacterium]
MSFQFSVFSFQQVLVLALCWTSTAAVAPARVLATDAAAPWRTTLSLGNDGYWKQRIRISLRNDADQPAEGQTLEVKVGKGDGLADLEGASADGLRLVDPAGAELLWAVTGPSGQAVKSGPIPAGSVLSIPAVCAAHGQAEYFLYFDNPASWSVPDFLSVAGSLRNAGVEEGQGDTPAGWAHDAGDEQHRAAWVAEQPHAGKKCLKTVVAEGAEPTWISTRQSGIRILGGARYAVHGWVKADNVKGSAGWYIHVGNAANAMILSPMLMAGGGSYDWKEVAAEFTAPKDADVADLGTVLRGTGTAWFDDVSLDRLSATQSSLTAQAAPPERLDLDDLGAAAPWPAGGDAEAWEYRCPVRVLNTSRRAATEGLTNVDLSGPLARLNGRVDAAAVRVMDGTKRVASFRVGNLLLFDGRAEPLTQHTFYVYFRRGTGAASTAEPGVPEYAANPALPGGQSKESPQAILPADYQRLLNSPRNLIKNPDFESGDPLPDHWFGGAKEQRPAGAKMGLVKPGLFGKRCVAIMFPAASQPEWFGWHQDVPVTPGKSYLLAAWLKCRGLSGDLQIHVHFRNAAGELCRERQMSSVGPALNGNADWTLLEGIFEMPADIATLQVHLTMQARGTAWHDGVVLTEVTPGRAGAMEARSAVRLAEPTVWPVNAIRKVFQDDAPPPRPVPARITAAGNDKEPLQIALRSPRALRQVQVVVELPVHADGTRLTDISLGVVGYVPVDHPTNYYNSKSPAWHRKVPVDPGRSDGWPGWWPDPILPRDTFDLAAQVTQSVWITVSVPKGAAAGDYHGTVRFTAAGATVAQTPFTVHVWDFTLPDEMHVKAIFDNHQYDPIWAVPGKTFEQTRRNFWRFMAQHRVCPDRIEPGPSLRYEQGRVIADFKAFDEAADFYFNTLKLPHSYTPADFYCFGWGYPPPAKFGEQPYEGTYPYAGADRGVLRPQFKQAYQACLKAFWEHIKAKGWERKFVLYISDEPFDSQKPIRQQMKALCGMVHAVDPTIPIYSSTWHHQPEWDGYVTVWGFGHYGIVPAEKLRQIRQDGATLWWTTDGQMCIDTPYCAVERLLPHYCFKYDAQAYEFWGIDWLTYDPYERGWHRYIHQSDQPGNSYDVRYPNGDGYLAYPGSPIGHAGPVTSVRLEQAREGCEDYEYLYLLREAIARAKKAGRDVAAAQRVLAQAQQLVTIPNAGGLQSTHFLPDPDAVLDVKESVARAIEGLK